MLHARGEGMQLARINGNVHSRRIWDKKASWRNDDITCILDLLYIHIARNFQYISRNLRNLICIPLTKCMKIQKCDDGRLKDVAFLLLKRDKIENWWGEKICWEQENCCFFMFAFSDIDKSLFNRDYCAKTKQKRLLSKVQLEIRIIFYFLFLCVQMR